jgi:hypothetical protein
MPQLSQQLSIVAMVKAVPQAQSISSGAGIAILLKFICLSLSTIWAPLLKLP